MVNTLTHYGVGIERAIKTPVKVKNVLTGTEIESFGVWDTGATNSVITKNAAQKLGLTLISMAEVRSGDGSLIRS